MRPSILLRASATHRCVKQDDALYVRSWLSNFANPYQCSLDWYAGAAYKQYMQGSHIIYRHTRATRVLHWLNALCVFLVLGSGLQIFNAHPRLYWGKYGADTDRAVLSGWSFPGWATIPSYQDLATGRRWHFFFAWVLVFSSALYFVLSFASRHVQRDLLLTRAQRAPSHLVRDFWNHARLRFPSGEAAKSYNSLQKLAYLLVLFVLAPMILATGLTMSPGMDAGYPWLLSLFGGRQSARTLHFMCAMTVVAFICVHLVMVVLAGPINELRSMITGRFVLPRSKSE